MTGYLIAIYLGFGVGIFVHILIDELRYTPLPLGKSDYFDMLICSILYAFIWLPAHTYQAVNNKGRMWL